MTKSFSKLSCMVPGQAKHGRYCGIRTEISVGEKGMEEIAYYLVFKMEKEWNIPINDLGSKEFLVYVFGVFYEK